MKAPQCRNCEGTDRYEKEVDARSAEFNLLPLYKNPFKSVKFRLEVCGTCGLMEWFVPDRHLDKMKDVFSKISN